MAGIYTCCKKPFINKLDKFLYSPAYFLLVGILTALSNIFSVELYVYTCFILMGIYICLLGRDLLPLLPLFACGYISPSYANNPGLHTDSVFSVGHGGIYLAIMVMLFVASLVYRLVTDPDFGGRKFLRTKRSLLSGMIVLGICYAISGLGSGQWEEYGLRNLFFAFLQFMAIAGLYYLLSGGVKWELAPKAYLFWTGICVGYTLLAELLNIYLSTDLLANGMIDRAYLKTGWGHYNNMGALFAIVIPLSFFLTGKGKLAFFGYLTASLFYIGLLLTCSRASILFGTAIYLTGYILSLIHTHHARTLIGMHIINLAAPIFLLVFYHHEFAQLFGFINDVGLTSDSRTLDYIKGLQQFAKFPIFGGTFFPVDHTPYVWPGPHFTYLFPARWHNTIIQLLASGGIVCLAGYLVHRTQTLMLFVEHFTTEKLFAALSILALLLTSLADCHLFNIGPVLLYSATLAFVEFRLDKHKDHLK